MGKIHTNTVKYPAGLIFTCYHAAILLLFPWRSSTVHSTRPTVTPHRCPAAMPHVVSRISLKLLFVLCESLLVLPIIAACVHFRHEADCSCISTVVRHFQLLGVESGWMLSIANICQHTTRPSVCNGMIIIIHRHVTARSPASIAYPRRSHPSTRTVISHLHFLRRPRTALGSAAAATAQCKCRFFASVLDAHKSRKKPAVRWKAKGDDFWLWLPPALLHLSPSLRQHKRSAVRASHRQTDT